MLRISCGRKLKKIIGGWRKPEVYNKELIICTPRQIVSGVIKDYEMGRAYSTTHGSDEKWK